MKEEIIKLWQAYLVNCADREAEYFRWVVDKYGPALYAKNQENKPSFEGFMSWLSLPTTESKEEGKTV